MTIDKSKFVELPNEAVIIICDLNKQVKAQHERIVNLVESQQAEITRLNAVVEQNNEAIFKIISEFSSSDPTYKDYENNYKDGWIDACNEITWAIEAMKDGIKESE